MSAKFTWQFVEKENEKEDPNKDQPNGVFSAMDCPRKPSRSFL